MDWNFQSPTLIAIQAIYCIFLNIFFTKFYFLEIHKRILQYYRSKGISVLFQSLSILIPSIALILTTKSPGAIFISLSISLIILSWSSRAGLPSGIFRFIFFNFLVCLKNFTNSKFPEFFGEIVNLLLNIAFVYLLGVIFVLDSLKKDLSEHSNTQRSLDLRYNGRNYLSRVDVSRDNSIPINYYESDSFEGTIINQNTSQTIIDQNTMNQTIADQQTIIDQDSENQHSENQRLENQHSENQRLENQHSENQRLENQHSENQRLENQHSENQQISSDLSIDLSSEFYPVQMESFIIGGSRNPLFYLFEVIFDNIFLLYSAKEKFHVVRHRAILSPIFTGVIGIAYFKVDNLFNFNFILSVCILFGILLHFCCKIPKMLGIVRIYTHALTFVFYYLFFKYCKKLSNDFLSFEENFTIFAEIFLSIQLSITVVIQTLFFRKNIFKANTLAFSILSTFLAFFSEIQVLQNSFLILYSIFPYIFCVIFKGRICRNMGMAMGFVCICYFYILKVMNLRSDK